MPARLALRGHLEGQRVNCVGLPRLRLVDLVQLVQDAGARRVEEDLLASAGVGEDHIAAHLGRLLRGTLITRRLGLVAL